MRASVIVPSWNGRHLLEVCLPSLRDQTFRDFETVVVDDGSTDDSLAWLREHHPEVRVLSLPVNAGFVAAVNAGIRATSSEIVVLLNNDTEVEPTWLEELIRSLDENPAAGLSASKLLLFDRRDHLHSAGDVYSLDGLPGNRGVWQRDDGRFDGDRWIFGACGGAAAYRRSMLDDIGLFDEQFGSYGEDVDLNLRAQLAGYGCVFAPRARVYHHVSATGGGTRASYHCGRNFIAIIAKDIPGDLLRRYWPRILLRQVRFTVEALRHAREPAARARLRGQLAGLLRLPRYIDRRRDIQRRRRVPMTYLEALMRDGCATSPPPILANASASAPTLTPPTTSV
jgi:GT2 family glycosyltransferase